jgi:hypothetical protein
MGLVPTREAEPLTTKAFPLLEKCCTLYTKEAQESYFMSKSLISRVAGREKKAQQLLSAGLVLSSIWEKARARMVFDLQRRRPAAGARSRGRQREVAGDRDSEL